MTWYADMLPHTITYQIPSGVSNYGDVTHSAQATASALVEEYVETIRLPSGDELQTTHRVATTVELPVESLLWLPGDNTSSADDSKKVRQSKRAEDFDGVGLTEVLL